MFFFLTLLRVFMLGIVYAPYRKQVYHSLCHYTECRYAEYRYAEYRGTSDYTLF